MQEFKSKRKPSEDEVKLYVGNGVQVEVEFIGTVELKLKSNFSLILENILYVLSVRRNLISLSKFDECGFSFNFNNDIFELIFKSQVVGNGFKCDGLYRLNLESKPLTFLHIENMGTKRALIKKILLNCGIDVWVIFQKKELID